MSSTELFLSGPLVPMLADAKLSSIRAGLEKTLTTAGKVSTRTSYSPLVRQLLSDPKGDEILIELPCKITDAMPNLLLIGSLTQREGSQAFLFPQVGRAKGIDNLKIHIMLVGALVDNAVNSVLAKQSTSQYEAQVKLLASLVSFKDWALRLKITPKWSDYKLTHHPGNQILTGKVLVSQDIKKMPARHEGQKFSPKRIVRVREYDATNYKHQRTSFEILTNDQVQVSVMCSPQAPAFGANLNLYSLRVATSDSSPSFMYGTEEDARIIFQSLEGKLKS